MRLLAPISMVALCGCSLVKLSDDIGRARCESNDDCEVLNDRDAEDFDPCKIWQCGETRFCQLLPLDEDDDGFSPAMCEPAADKQDCDDRRKDRNPGLSESCDGTDNDCDLLVDEGALNASTNPLVVFSGADEEGPTSIVYARDPETENVAIAYGITRSQNHVPGFSTSSGTLDEGANARELRSDELNSMLASELGVTAIGGDRFAVAMFNTSGTRRLLAGIVDAQSNKIEFEENLATDGITCEESSCELGSDLLTGLSVGTADGDVILSYVRSPSPDATCGEFVDANTAPVAWAARLAAAPRGLRQIGGGGFQLGESSDPTGTALLGVEQETAIGWLAAFAAVDGGLRVHWLTREGPDLNSEDDWLAVTATDAPLSNPALALGPETDAGRLLGLVYRRGCGNDSHVVMELFEISDAGKGSLAHARISEATEVGETSNESDPVLAYSESQDSWIVVYRDARGLRARLTTRTGTLRGESPYVLIDQMGTGIGVLPSPGVFASTGGWFDALAATNESGEPLAIEAVHLGCNP